MSSFQSFVGLADKVLTGHSQAHSVYATNIANANTPNYKAKIPEFEVMLDKAKVMAQGAGILEGIPDPQGQLWKLQSQVKESNDRVGQNGNNVKLDQEMVSMADEGMAYMSSLRLLSKQFAITRYAISGQ